MRKKISYQVLTQRKFKSTNITKNNLRGEKPYQELRSGHQFMRNKKPIISPEDLPSMRLNESNNMASEEKI